MRTNKRQTFWQWKHSIHCVWNESWQLTWQFVLVETPFVVHKSTEASFVWFFFNKKLSINNWNNYFKNGSKNIKIMVLRLMKQEEMKLPSKKFPPSFNQGKIEDIGSNSCSECNKTFCFRAWDMSWRISK